MKADVKAAPAEPDELLEKKTLRLDVTLKDVPIEPQPIVIGIAEGDRVFHRCADAYGRVVKIDRRLDEDRALVKYEWPFDQKAEPFDVPLKELVPAHEVSQR